MRIALIHDWLTGMRGGEYVLEAIAELVPSAEIFTLLHIPASVSPTLTAMKRHTSSLQRMPGAEKRYRHYLPLMPRWIEEFDLSDFELVISSSHCVAKGVRKASGAVHVSYVHAPMRYMWDRFDDYFGAGRASLPTRMAANLLRPYFQKWDQRVSQVDRVDALVGNSRYIASQIEIAYGRKAEVVYPFANLERFTVPRKIGRHYLIVGAFAPYKRIDLAIRAFNRMKLPLLIVGGGQDAESAKKIAGPTIEFLGPLSNSAIVDLYAKCRAFIFPGKEDFGITPIESMAAGAPVVAFGEGGAAETVVHGETGLLFHPQTEEALIEAVMKIETGAVQISEQKCRERAEQFTRERFKTELSQVIHRTWLGRGKDSKLLPREILEKVE